MTKSAIKLSVVVACYNEEDVLLQFHKELFEYLKEINAEVIYVDDGSEDNTAEVLSRIYNENKYVKIISFSRNFGHEAAMLAGIDHAAGESIICMDSDLQHPPEAIPDMLSRMKEGYDIVNMVRNSRKDNGFMKKLCSRVFYLFLNRISKIKIEPNASDFFLITEKVAKIFRTDYRERNRFLRGFIQSIGFKKTTITFDAPERFAGKSKYSFKKLILFSVSAIVVSSINPLRVSTLIGVGFGIFSIIVAVYSLVVKITGDPVSGYTTLIVFLSIAFSLLFFILGIIGEYIAYMFIETKKRPIYIIRDLKSQN